MYEDTETTEVYAPETQRENAIPVIAQLSVALGALVLLFGASYTHEIAALFADERAVVGDVQENARASVPDTEGFAPVSESEEHALTVTDPFADIALTARSAYVWDVNAQRALFKKNPDMQWPLASITKLMTALVAYEILESDDAVEVSGAAVRQSGDSGLYGGEQFARDTLLDFVLLTSSNDGAYALAAAAGGALFPETGDAQTFIDAMNIRAEEIGLSQTYFRNPTGLDESAEMGGAYGSARDVAFLMEYIITTYPHILEGTREEAAVVENLFGETHVAENTNQYVTDIEGIIASKTGYTDLAGGNLVIAFDAGLNHPVVISVLGSTYHGRFADVLALTHAVQAYIANLE